jgi:stage IV sporulation protein FB
VYLHATLPLGLALVSQFAFRPSAWVALVIIILVHEAGHAVLLRRHGLPVLHVVVHGFGGECETVDWITPWQRAVVAWGGVLAQALLFVFVTLSLNLGLWPPGSITGDFYSNLTASNLLLACFNLLPLGSLDGREAWRLPWFAFLRAKHSWLAWRLHRVRAAASRADSERLH